MFKKFAALLLGASIFVSTVVYGTDNSIQADEENTIGIETTIEKDWKYLEKESDISDELGEVDANLSELGEDSALSESDGTEGKRELAIAKGEIRRFIVKYRSKEIDNLVECPELYTLKMISSKDINRGSFILIDFIEGVDSDSFVENAELIFGENNIEYIQPDYEILLSANVDVLNELYDMEERSTAEYEAAVTNDSKHVDEISGTDMYNTLELTSPQITIFQEEPDEIPSNNEMESKDATPNNGIELSDNEFFQNVSNTENDLKKDEFEVEQTSSSDDSEYQEVKSEVSLYVDMVAIVDSGADVSGVIDSGKIFINEVENGIDDDGNGYIDDVLGWNFCDDNNVIYNSDDEFDYEHGTLVMESIAQNYDVKLLNLKAFKNGMAYTSDIIEAIYYAESMGASTACCLFSVSEENTALNEVINNSTMQFVGIENGITYSLLQQVKYFDISGIDVDTEQEQINIRTSYSDNNGGYISIKLIDDLTGKIVYLGQEPAVENTFTVDMSGYHSGIYTLYMKLDGCQKVERSFIYASETENLDFYLYGSTAVISGVFENSPNKRVSIKLIDENKDIIAISQSKTNENGEFSINFSEFSAYSIFAAFVAVEGQKNVYVLGNIHNRNICDKVSYINNEALYNALKKARPELDANSKGIITAEELMEINGTLILSNANISSIDGLQYCTGITMLYIDGNNIDDISPLSNLTELKGLFAQNNCIGGLPELPVGIEIINLSNNFLTTVASLGKLTNLKSVFLDDNYISEISFINGTKNLKWLSIRNNNLISIYSASKATKILHLDASNNNINSVEALEGLYKLRDLRLSNNQITGIEEISGHQYDYLYIDGNQIVYLDLDSVTATNLLYDTE